MYLFDTKSLRRNYFEKAAALLKDPSSGISKTLLDDNKTKIILLGTSLWTDCRAIMEQFDVVALVDDRRANGNERVLNRPIVSTENWISMAKADKSIVSVPVVNTPNAFNFFGRIALSNELPFASLLDLLRFMDLKGAAAKIQRRFSLGLLYSLPFFKCTLQNAEEFGMVADSFDDEFSRITAWSLLNYRLTGEPHFLWESSVGFNSDKFTSNSYEINSQFFKPTGRDVFVDGGCYKGGSTRQFVKAVDNKFKQVYCYEPSSVTINDIKSTVKLLDYDYTEQVSDRITIIEKGLWSEEKTLKFNPLGFASADIPPWANESAASHLMESDFTAFLYEDGREIENCISVPVTSIDLSAADATFIKLEVEGSELEALNGAKDTIKRNRPSMCIGFYHKPTDWLEIPKFLRESGQDYRMGIRQHNNLVPDATVLYCAAK